MQRHNWILLHDGKPGHTNQLKGIVAAARARGHVLTDRWVDVTSHPRLTEDWGKQDSTLVFGAGHKTHKYLLAARWLRSYPTVVLMSPSLPQSAFSYVIKPKHDARCWDGKGTLRTEGALNEIGTHSYSPENLGLILLGGASKHYHWDTNRVLESIRVSISEHPEYEWAIADSRRTPNGLLTSNHFPNNRVRLFSHRETPYPDLVKLMSRAKRIWVTPDSVSMLYEALSSGAQCGAFRLTPKKRSRVAARLETLLDRGRLDTVTFSLEIRHAENPFERLNESDRAIEWLNTRV